MTVCTAVIECEHTSNRKIATLAPGLCFSLFTFVPICILIYFCYHFYVGPELFGCCYHQQMIATFPPEGHLIPRQEKKKNINLWSVNELPCILGVKGVSKLTEAFVMALLSHFLPLTATLSALPPALQFSPSTCLLHAPAAPCLWLWHWAAFIVSTVHV